ncbi:MAG TPA: LytR C-terminal domain-containing protein [Mycobacteriales bacterium]|nr:LytR C-terminal domain-containing protein [Mycobacteriales bacterium]
MSEFGPTGGEGRPGDEPLWEPNWDPEPEPTPPPSAESGHGTAEGHAAVPEPGTPAPASDPPSGPVSGPTSDAAPDAVDSDTAPLATRPRSHRAPPPGAQFGRVLGPVVALVVVGAVVALLIWINGKPNGSTAAAAGGSHSAIPSTPASSPSTTAPASPSPSTSVPVAGGPSPGASSPVASGGSPSASSATTHTGKPADRTAKAPVQVLNNSRLTGLAHQVAGEIESKGWHVGVIGNLQGVISETTVYYSAGNKAAAKHLAREFAEVRRVEPNSDVGLTQTGITLVITADWVS